MAKSYTLITEEQSALIQNAAVFFVASADPELVVPVKQTVTYRASFGHVVLFQEYRKRLRSK